MEKVEIFKYDIRNILNLKISLVQCLVMNVHTVIK